MSTSYSGVNGVVKSGSLDMDVEGWSAEVDVHTYDSTTTADAGWEDVGSATKSVKGSFDFFYNVAKKPTSTTTNLGPGSTPNLVFVIGDSGDQITGKGLITKLSVKSKTKDGIKCTASFTNKGPWTLPS